MIEKIAAFIGYLVICFVGLFISKHVFDWSDKHFMVMLLIAFVLGILTIFFGIKMDIYHMIDHMFD